MQQKKRKNQNTFLLVGLLLFVLPLVSAYWESGVYASSSLFVTVKDTLMNRANNIFHSITGFVVDSVLGIGNYIKSIFVRG